MELNDPHLAQRDLAFRHELEAVMGLVIFTAVAMVAAIAVLMLL